MTVTTEEHEVFPYLIHCKGCNEDHVAIGLEKYEIEYLRDVLSENIEMNEYSLTFMIKDGKFADKEDQKFMKNEIEISRHLLNHVIKPGLK